MFVFAALHVIPHPKFSVNTPTENDKPNCEISVIFDIDSKPCSNSACPNVRLAHNSTSYFFLTKHLATVFQNDYLKQLLSINIRNNLSIKCL